MIEVEKPSFVDASPATKVRGPIKVYYTDGTLANTIELFDDSLDSTQHSYPEEFVGLFWMF